MTYEQTLQDEQFRQQLLTYGSRCLIYTGNGFAKGDVLNRRSAWNEVAVMNIRMVRDADLPSV